MSKPQSLWTQCYCCVPTSGSYRVEEDKFYPFKPNHSVWWEWWPHVWIPLSRFLGPQWWCAGSGLLYVSSIIPFLHQRHQNSVAYKCTSSSNKKFFLFVFSTQRLIIKLSFSNLVFFYFYLDTYKHTAATSCRCS